MKQFLIIILTCNLFLLFTASAQTKQPVVKGKLFIIGGGDRGEELMKALVSTAALGAKDYVVVLPMSSEQPDTSYYYFKEDLQKACSNAIVNLNFTNEKVNDKHWLDSLQNARLIFITGGDQQRFMKVVLHTPVYDAIYKAYAKGATIAGTSAGAAVMSEKMITGNELTDTVYRATFKKIHDKNIEIQEGLGLLTGAIIDQHFIVRSRYNRLFSALAKYPKYACIGIDEATAIIVQNNKVTVAGESQVVLLQKPVDLKITKSGLVKMKSAELSMFTAGDTFFIKQAN
jgi:cyanophycinase